MQGNIRKAVSLQNKYQQKWRIMYLKSGISST